MARTVTARTLDVFTGSHGDTLTFAAVTVLLVRMTHTQVRFWADIAGDAWKGTTPVEGYELRAADGSLLGAALPLGHLATRIHVEWYDPQADDFYGAGETDAVMTQAVARVLDARRRHVGDVPLGRDTVLDPQPVRFRRNTTCPFAYCVDADCIDHGPVWATARTSEIQEEPWSSLSKPFAGCGTTGT